jgi:uncharacterized protein YjbI with pentapeptide repeats
MMSNTNKELEDAIDDVINADTDDFKELAKRFGLDLSTELAGVDLSEVDLRGESLFEADLRESNLSGAHLQGTDLRGANLQNANLAGAELINSKLEKANFRGANVNGAKFWGSTGLSAEEVQALRERGGDFDSKPFDPQSLPPYDPFLKLLDET